MVCLLAVIVLLCGCGAKMGDSDLKSRLEKFKEVSGEAEDRGSDEEEGSEGVFEEINTEEPDSEADDKEDVEDTEDPSNPGVDADRFAAAFEKGVTHNGDYFVEVADKVYFRLISPDSMEEGAVFGEFLDCEWTPVECPLICFDPDTGDWDAIGDITGTGRLYACPEGFYIGVMDQEDVYSNRTDLFDLSTGESSEYCDGLPLGVSKSGELLAVNRYIGQDSNTVLIREGKEIVRLGDEGHYYEYCGFAGEDLIVLLSTADEEYYLCSVDEDGEVTTLGQIDAPQSGYPELGEFLI